MLALSPIDASEFAPRHLYLQAAIKDLRKLLLQNGYPQGVITFNINDVLNKSKNKPNNSVQATVPKKDILIVLPYLGLHSNQVTKRLKSCVYNLYSFVNLKIIFQNTRRIKSFFPYKDRLNRSQRSKVIYKAVAGTVMNSTLAKQNEDSMIEKQNISKPSRKVTIHQPLLIM